MSGEEKQSSARRLFLARLGTAAGIVSATAFSASGDVKEDSSWRPARYPQDDWLDKIPGQHRLVFDTTTPDGIAVALRFAGNYFTANRQAYGLKDSDLAVVIVMRHKSTAFGYNDAMWAKYGKQFSQQSGFDDPKTKQPPRFNAYATAQHTTGQEVPIDALVKQGVHFAVCSMSTHGIAGMIAEANGTKAETVVEEIEANLVGNARMVPAGIVAVSRAQEHGYSLVTAV